MKMDIKQKLEDLENNKTNLNVRLIKFSSNIENTVKQAKKTNEIIRPFVLLLLLDSAIRVLKIVHRTIIALLHSARPF